MSGEPGPQAESASVTGVEPRRPGSGLELVAEPPHGDDVARVGRVGLDLGAQAADVDVDQATVTEVAVAPDPLQQDLAAETRPGLEASSTSRRNSVLVRWTSSPSRSTTPSSGTISRSPNLQVGDRPDRLVRARRSSARMRADSSLGANGLVR